MERNETTQRLIKVVLPVMTLYCLGVLAALGIIKSFELSQFSKAGVISLPLVFVWGLIWSQARHYGGARK